jgi:F-type H+-transporting ATPase subunit delta
MASHAKTAGILARRLFKLSLADGAVSAERVGGVLAYVERHRPPHPAMVLKAYQRLIAAEIARSRALVEHAGAVSDASLQAISSHFSEKYGRSVSAAAQPNPSLLAGLRIRVGDDVFESSISAQLAALAAAV